MRPDQAEFLKELYQEQFSKLQLYARALLEEYAYESEVVVQDAFHTACEKIDKVMASPNPVGWMKRTIKHKVKNLKRRKQTEVQRLLSWEELVVEPGQIDATEADALDAYRALVKPEEFQLVKSIVLDGVPHMEKAEELGITVWACYKRVDRILLKMKRGLEDEKQKNISSACPKTGGRRHK